MGCFSPNNKKSSRAHPDLIENFSYKKSCADWAENFHLKLVFLNRHLFLSILYRERDNHLSISPSIIFEMIQNAQ